MDLPKGISRHEVRFVGYDEGIYAIKELPGRPARSEWENLRWLESVAGPAVIGTGYVLLGQVISPWQVAGIVIVVGALIYATRSKSDDTQTELVPDSN